MNAQEPVVFTNCHTHTFTHKHTPDRYLPPPFNYLLRIGFIRRAVLAFAHWFDPKHQGKVGRYAQILETSYGKDQEAIFRRVQSFYPNGTRFVVLPMDMEYMGLGGLEESVDVQHEQLHALAQKNQTTLIPFAAVDARRGQHGVDRAIERLQNGFRGIKLYPPIGYHPYDKRLWPLYDWAATQNPTVPVLTHCSRPASVQFHGTPTREMQTDPESGHVGNRERYELLTWFTDPDSYRALLKHWPNLRVCLAHFGGAGDWDRYLENPWDATSDTTQKSWLAKIADMIRSGEYPNLWTDISYTLFADDEYVYLLKTLLSDDRILDRTLFGSDFYVVESARLEERRRSMHIRAVLGETLFTKLAVDNPKEFLR
jgi:predicted TIM-barrel fold metal-dependent hydrolase